MNHMLYTCVLGNTSPVSLTLTTIDLECVQCLNIHSPKYSFARPFSFVDQNKVFDLLTFYDIHIILTYIGQICSTSTSVVLFIDTTIVLFYYRSVSVLVFYNVIICQLMWLTIQYNSVGVTVI